MVISIVPRKLVHRAPLVHPYQQPPEAHTQDTRIGSNHYFLFLFLIIFFHLQFFLHIFLFFFFVQRGFLAPCPLPKGIGGLAPLAPLFRHPCSHLSHPIIFVVAHPWKRHRLSWKDIAIFKQFFQKCLPNIYQMLIFIQYNSVVFCNSWVDLQYHEKAENVSSANDYRENTLINIIFRFDPQITPRNRNNRKIICWKITKKNSRFWNV